MAVVDWGRLPSIPAVQSVVAVGQALKKAVASVRVVRHRITTECKHINPGSGMA